MSRFVPSWGPKKKPVSQETLYLGKSYEVQRLNGRVEMAVDARWSRSHSAAAERHGVDSLTLSHRCVEGGLGFLADLSGVRSLTISVPLNPADLRPLERLSQLEELRIFRGSLVSIGPPGELDFSAMRKLVSCTLAPYWAQWETVFRCANLRGLHLMESRDLNELDLIGLPKLTQLVFGGLPKLVSFRVAPSARVQSMQLRSCTKLHVDWPRAGRDLQYLWIEKKPAYPFTELRHAAGLKGLMLSFCRRIDSAEFLRDLPGLEWLELFLTDFDEDGYRVIRSMKKLRANIPIARERGTD
jgi:hypothetical protein